MINRIKIASKTKERWNCSFKWKAGPGEVLLSGGPSMLEALVKLKVLAPESLK